MKKFLLAIVAMVCVASVSAQDYKNSIGLRVGYGAELQYERHFSAVNYLAVNLGLSDFGGDRVFVNGTYYKYFFISFICLYFFNIHTPEIRQCNIYKVIISSIFNFTQLRFFCC